MSIRQATINDFLKLVYDCFDLFLRENKSVCCQTNYTKECDAITCGSLVIGLHAIGLWPQKSADTINISVRDLASKLGSLRILKYYDRNYEHNHCGLVRLSGKIASTLSSIPDPVLESHRRHMRIQGMK